MDLTFFILLIEAISVVVIVDVFSSWIVRDPNAFPRNITQAVAGPLYAPFRLVFKPERFGGIDISPIFVLLGLRFLALGLQQLGS